MARTATPVMWRGATDPTASSCRPNAKPAASGLGFSYRSDAGPRTLRECPSRPGYRLFLGLECFENAIAFLVDDRRGSMKTFVMTVSPAKICCGAAYGLGGVLATTCYCFFSGIAGVTGCAPPVDFGPGVTPALFSVELLELLAAAASLSGIAPFVGPLPASLVDVAPFVGPLLGVSFRLCEGRDRDAESDH